MVEYVHKAVKVICQNGIKTEEEVWDQYVNWSTLCWQGDVQKVITELETWLSSEGESQKETPPVLENDSC